MGLPTIVPSLEPQGIIAKGRPLQPTQTGHAGRAKGGAQGGTTGGCARERGAVGGCGAESG